MFDQGQGRPELPRLCAVGHDKPGRRRVWWMAAFPRTEAGWREFLALCGGTSRLEVRGFDKALRKAVRTVFLRAGEPIPGLRRCELHLRRTLEKARAPLECQPDHPLMRAFRQALFDHRNWTRSRARPGAPTK